MIAAGTTIPAGGYYVVEESVLGFGLGGTDSVRLFAAGGAPVDTVSWTGHAAVTLGRCPNGTGAVTANPVSTKGAINSCVAEPGTAAWPGGATVATTDPAGVLGGNMSGLIYEPSGSAATGSLWAVKNGPGTLYRLVSDGTNWAPEAGRWSAGRPLRYGDGTGNPDAEGVTFGANASAGIFVATERNNDASSVSRNSILRFDPSVAGATLNATNEWNLTADLPANGANLGLEAIAWVPDTELVAEGFVDATTGAAYNPANYPNHGTGLFLVGVEAGGGVYAYALDLTGSSFTRVATIAAGFTGIMELQFDRELGNLWAVCDDGCQGRSTVLEVNSAGAYAASTIYNRPAGMANLNNEGFALAPLAECVSGGRPVFWADDAATGGNAIRSGTLTCAGPAT